MKADFHFHFYSRIGIMAVLAMILFFSHQSVHTPVETIGSETNSIEIGGWAWSEEAGWISLNCKNDFDGDGELEDTCATAGGIDYGLEVVDVGGYPRVQGCAWGGTPLASGLGDCDDGSGYCFPVGSACGSGGTCEAMTLGYMCFSNNNDNSGFIGGGTQAEDSGVPTSTPLFNALDAGYYASILNWESLGSFPWAWAVGWPAQNPVTYSNYPINGCFNCYVKYENYFCQGTPGDPCDCGGEVETCVPGTCSSGTGTCVAREVHDYCDNCLEYFYYDQATKKCSESPYQTCNDDVDCSGSTNLCITYETGDLESVIGGYDCSDCTIENLDNVCGVNSYQGNINRCNSCVSTYQTPGLMIDNQANRVGAGERGALCGWAWNAWGGGSYGLGWVQFSPRIVTSTKPYITADLGSIYSKGDIFGRYYPPFSHGNASYLIEAGGQITNFISSSTLSGDFQGEFSNRPSIDFLNLSNGKYRNALGTIDYDGLITVAYTDSGNDYNKFDSLLVTDPADFENEFVVSAPDGKTVYATGDLTTTGFTIRKGDFSTTEPERGSAVVVVDGDLTIEGDISYETGGVTIENLKQIPSIVWVVRGDVFIEPAVAEVAGTFIVLGNGASCSEASQCFVDHTADTQRSCGQFISCTGTDVECAANSLEVKGIVIARLFELCRSYYDDVLRDPAEAFFNDGRLHANPPPGFVDFSSVVPRFSESPN